MRAQWYVRAPGILIGLLVLSSVTWAAVGKWPVVVEASGQLQPLEGLRPVKSDQGGTIVEVLVKNNQDVRSGEVLVKLDPAISQAEIDRLQEQAKLLRQNISEREAQKTGSAFQAREREYEQRLNAAEADVKRNQAAIEEAQAQRDDLQGQLATEQEREKRLRSVVEQGAISRERLIEIQGNLNSLENQIQAQNNRIDQAQQSYESAKIEVDRIEEEYQREIAEEANYIQEQISSRNRELADVEGQLELARERRKTQDIQAPVAGRIYDVKATKGTVQPAEELLSIFPERGRLILKVSVQNQDRALIEEGMPVKVAIADLPFQDYGKFDGTLTEISPNAVEENQRWVYQATVELNEDSVRAKDVELSAGVEATASIVSDRNRTVLQFLLDPVKRRIDEASKTR